MQRGCGSCLIPNDVLVVQSLIQEKLQIVSIGSILIWYMGHSISPYVGSHQFVTWLLFSHCYAFLGRRSLFQWHMRLKSEFGLIIADYGDQYE